MITGSVRKKYGRLRDKSCFPLRDLQRVLAANKCLRYRARHAHDHAYHGYLDTLPVNEIVEELRHLGRVFRTGETPKLGEGEVVKTEEEQVPEDHV